MLICQKLLDKWQAGPDQMLHSDASDLISHCLPRPLVHYVGYTRYQLFIVNSIDAECDVYCQTGI